MSPFPQRKIFWKQNIKPSKKCRLQHRKWEYAISKLAYKTSSLLRPEKKHATKILQCSLSRQETKGTCARNTDDCSAKGPFLFFWRNSDIFRQRNCEMGNLWKFLFF
jgi:hypothetical protein